MKRAMLFLLFSFTQARDGLVSLAPRMDEERPAPYAASRKQAIFSGCFREWLWQIPLRIGYKLSNAFSGVDFVADFLKQLVLRR